MNYSDLSKTQKRCVDAFVKLRPELATASQISRTEIEELFLKLHAERANGGEKIGYPTWITKNLAVARGMYQWPAPGLETSEKKTSKPAVKAQPKVEVEKEDEEFFTELAEHGIIETA